MDWASTHQYLEHSGEEICENCGRKFKIRIFRQKGHDETEEYQCPHCQKKYYVRACNTPEIHKIN